MVAVYLFVPNLIGYLRIITGMLSFYFAFTYPGYFVGLYTFSYWLDALDGVAARQLGQSAPHGDRAEPSLRPFHAYRTPSRRFRLQCLASGRCSTW